MPLYEYECPKDGRFELIRKFSDPPLLVCPTCGQPIEKLLSSPAIQFKGSGWYITDYARKGGDGSFAKDAAKDKGPSESGGKDVKTEGTKDSGTKESGTKDSGSKDSGGKDGGKSDSGKSASAKSESGKSESAKSDSSSKSTSSKKDSASGSP